MSMTLQREAQKFLSKRTDTLAHQHLQSLLVALLSSRLLNAKYNFLKDILVQNIEKE